MINFISYRILVTETANLRKKCRKNVSLWYKRIYFRTCSVPQNFSTCPVTYCRSSGIRKREPCAPKMTTINLKFDYTIVGPFEATTSKILRVNLKPDSRNWYSRPKAHTYVKIKWKEFIPSSGKIFPNDWEKNKFESPSSETIFWKRVGYFLFLFFSKIFITLKGGCSWKDLFFSPRLRKWKQIFFSSPANRL